MADTIIAGTSINDIDSISGRVPYLKANIDHTYTITSPTSANSQTVTVEHSETANLWLAQFVVTASEGYGYTHSYVLLLPVSNTPIIPITYSSYNIKFYIKSNQLVIENSANIVYQYLQVSVICTAIYDS